VNLSLVFGLMSKTGIGAKRPLDTPLLSPTQLTPTPQAPAPRPPESAGSYTDSDTQPVTSLNERLQKAASARSAAPAGNTPTAAANEAPSTAPTQPLHKSWPTEPHPANAVPHAVGQVTPAPPMGQPLAPAKLQPLPELRSQIPVPLMPLEPRGGNSAPLATDIPGAAAKPKRNPVAKPELSASANAGTSRSHGRSLGIGLTLAIIVGGGGWLAYTSGGTFGGAVKSTATASSAPTAASSTVAPSVPVATEPPAKIASATLAANSTVAPSATDGFSKATPFLTLAKTADQIDADLKRSAVWKLIASEFPEWHRDRVNEIAKLVAEKRDATAISRHIAEALVSLRRKFADQALSASPERLRAVAVAFLDNLRQLSAQSTDACYGFISQGETYPAVIDLMRQGDKTEALHKQSVAVFEAVAFGRKTPQTNLPPRKVDYDTLAAELTARGWSQADLQMFSDAKALAAAPPEQVCKMVQDWFAAQIAIKDPAVQLRLLIESLRPVVAG
jgi:hypothetical protein